MAEVSPDKARMAPASLAATLPPLTRSVARSGGRAAREIPGVESSTVPSHGLPAGSAPSTTAPSPMVAMEKTLPERTRPAAAVSG